MKLFNKYLNIKKNTNRIKRKAPSVACYHVHLRFTMLEPESLYSSCDMYFGLDVDKDANIEAPFHAEKLVYGFVITLSRKFTIYF